MAKIDLSAPPAFGYVGPKVNADKAGRALGKGHHTLRKIAHNGLKITGYIPIIGIVSGVVRIARAVFSEYKPSSPNLSLAGHIFRGGVEIIGLGAVFLPVDLVTTVYRRFFKEPASPQTSPQPVNEPQPPVIGNICLKLYNGYCFAENVQFGVTFEDDIYREAVKNDPTYANQTLKVIFEGRELDYDGKMKGEFPLVNRATILHVVPCGAQGISKNARKI